MSSRKHKHSDDELPAQYNQQQQQQQQRTNTHTHRERSRSRSRSPEYKGHSDDEKRDRLEEERRDRMARLRAQNDEEEQRLAIMDRNEEEKQDAMRRARKAKEEILTIDPQELEGLDEDEQMQRLLGFSGFASTKGAEVEDNKNSAANGAATKNKARKYRQYMNRKGGFNRPLEKMD
jgi:U4/U6.U5 tri-snRNP-associated protein 3